MKCNFAYFLVFIFLIGCKSNVYNEIVNYIHSKCNSGSWSCEVRMKDIVRFKWDKFYVFNIHATEDEMGKVMNLNYNGWEDLTWQFVFCYKGEIVYRKVFYYNPDYPETINFYFNDTLYCQEYTPKTAIFKVNREESDQEVYTLIPVRGNG